MRGSRASAPASSCATARARDCAGNDLLIAIERPPPAKNGALAIGIAGRGFDGNLTSDSTRLDGYVLSTDVAPTILERLGIAVPSQMSGQAIRAEGTVDAAAIESLGERMAVISERRGPVIGLSLLVWLVVAGPGARGQLAGGSARVGDAAGRPERSSTCRCCCLPARRSSRARTSEQLLVMLGAPLLAALTLVAARRLPGACGRLGADRARLRDRRDRRLAADLALAARAQPRARRALLRDRQRARGAARRARRRRHRRRRWPGFAPRLSRAALRRRLPRRSACSPPSSSPPAASAPTSAPRSSCRSAAPWPPRRSPRGAGAPRCS